MRSKGMKGWICCSTLLVFLFSMGLLFSAGTCLATDKVVLGELFSRDN
jgi:hypothetical protein